jgi:hypothetical protein
MKAKTFLPIAAVLYFGFGLGLLLAPTPFMSVYGVSLDPGGVLMARILGAALIGFALVFWQARPLAASPALHAVFLASFVYNVLDLPIVAIATISGVMSSFGWSAVGLHVFLAAGFGYLTFKREDG